jgi:hypothetical protein
MIRRYYSKQSLSALYVGQSHVPQSRLRFSATTLSLAWAVSAVALLLLWQFLTVHYNREGNWTALFCTGQLRAMPVELEARTYRFPNTNGYDGEMYRYVAHDPFLQLGFAQYVDGVVLRYSRILVPGLAFLIAGGRQDLIDWAYIAVVAIFVFLGAYWLSQWASFSGFHPACGAAFLLVPATLVSMDRMTVDVALAALAVGVAFYSKTESPAKLYVVLVMACLVRETGVLLVAACCLVDLFAKRYKEAAIWATAGLPLVGWYLFLSTKLAVYGDSGGVPRWVYRRLGPGLVGRLLNPIRYPLIGSIEVLTRSLDVVALAGIAVAIVAAIILLRLRPFGTISVAGALYAALGVGMVNIHYWDWCYSYARVFSPLLIFIALETTAAKHRTRGWWWALAPTALVDLRIGLQLGLQALGILRGISGH